MMNKTEKEKEQLEKTGKMFQEKYPLSSEMLKSSKIISKRFWGLFAKIFIVMMILVIVIQVIGYSFYLGGPVIGIIITVCIIYFGKKVLKNYNEN